MVKWFDFITVTIKNLIVIFFLNTYCFSFSLLTQKKHFLLQISSSKITANLDDLDGALDAIWQILVCDKEIGWSTNARKIILLATDSLLHMAGDGLLVGAVLKLKDDECLLDNEGNHKEPLKYDFPSVGEIDTLLKDKKVNIIFAVKSRTKMEYYQNITRDLIKDSAFVGELEANSGNILDLITKGKVCTIGKIFVVYIVIKILSKQLVNIFTFFLLF